MSSTVCIQNTVSIIGDDVIAELINKWVTEIRNRNFASGSMCGIGLTVSNCITDNEIFCCTS